MSEKLLPCPFCGKSVYSELRKIWGYDRHQIFCACGCHSPNFGRGEELTAWWNTRPSLPVSEPGVREALVEARDKLLDEGLWLTHPLIEKIDAVLAPPSPSPAPSQENDRG